MAVIYDKYGKAYSVDIAIANSPAPSGGSTTVQGTYPAGSSVSGGMVVMFSGNTVVPFDPSVDTNYTQIVGISNNGATIGNPVTVIMEGLLTSPGAFVVGPYYAGSGGTLTQSVPTTGILVEVGNATDANTLIVRVRQPIITI